MSNDDLMIKNDYVSKAVHTILTPLTSLRWGTETLLTEKADPLSEKQKSRITKMRQSTLRLIRITHALLNMSRIESGRLAITPRQTDVNELIKNAVTKFIPLADEHHVMLHFQQNDSNPTLAVDPALLTYAINTLVHNAIMYSPTGNNVTILFTTTPSSCSISVIDTGVGIPDSEKQHIFEPFFQSSKASESNQDGIGMRLCITKKIMELSGGEISFESTENRGSNFTLSLPITGSKKMEGDVTIIEEEN